METMLRYLRVCALGFSFLKIPLDGLMVLSGAACTTIQSRTMERCDLVVVGGMPMMNLLINIYNILHCIYCIFVVGSLLALYGVKTQELSINFLAPLCRRRRSSEDPPRKKMIFQEFYVTVVTVLMYVSVIWAFGLQEQEWQMVVTETLEITANTALVYFFVPLSLDRASIFHSCGGGREAEVRVQPYGEASGGGGGGGGRGDDDEDDDDDGYHSLPAAVLSGATEEGRVLWVVDHDHDREIQGSGDRGETQRAATQDRNRGRDGGHHRPKHNRQEIRHLLKLGCFVLMIHNAAYLAYDVLAMTVRVPMEKGSEEAPSSSTQPHYAVVINTVLMYAIIYYRLILTKFYYKKC